MNRQTKQRGGRLQSSDNTIFSVADAYLPTINDPRLFEIAWGQALLEEEFQQLPVNLDTTTFRSVFSTFSDCHTAETMKGMRVIDGSLAPPWHCSIDLFGFE